MSQTYRGCQHENRIFLVTYKPTLESTYDPENECPKLLCNDCRKNPDFVNDSVVDKIFNIETGEQIR